MMIFLFLRLFSLLSLAYPPVDKDQLQKEISRLVSKVPEFTRLDAIAREKGGRAWLFGGSAASFAHYAKESLLLRQGQGDIRPHPFAENSRGEIDYTEIFRPTQDLDLVAEGGTEVALALENEVARMGYLKGTKGGQWDIRSLRVAHNGKEPLLGDFGFANQHTDSHSVGMVRLGDGVVRDLLHWDMDGPPFLLDVAEGKLGFIFRRRHRQTLRYREGKNPEILSAIRYLIKLSQHLLRPLAKDLATVKGIVEDFNPATIQGYVRHWMEVNVPKLFLHSQDVEHAWNMLEETGLRKKLLQIGHPETEGSPAWWANKEPLRSSPVGRGSGKTAQELDIHTLAHDTQNFLLWTVITRSRKGHPNVFVSRYNVTGERAASGEGHYTVANSEKGFGNTDFTVRYRLDPDAREGSDFKIRGDGTVLVLNKSAIQVIPERVSVVGVAEYFELLFSDSVNRIGMAGLREHFKRKALSGYATNPTKGQVLDILRLLKKRNQKFLWERWFSLPLSAEYPWVLRWPMIKNDGHFLAKSVLSQKHWAAYPQFVQALIDKGDRYVLEVLAEYTLSQEHWAAHPQFVHALIEKGDRYVLGDLAMYTLSQEHWAAHPQFVQALIEKGDQYVLEALAMHTLSQEHWGDHPQFVHALIETGGRKVLRALAIYTLSRKHWGDHPQFVHALIEKGDQDVLQNLARHTLTQERWGDHPQLVHALIEKGDRHVLWDLATHTLTQEHWGDHPQLVHALFERGNRPVRAALNKYVLLAKHWRERPQLRKLVGPDGKITATNLLKATRVKDCISLLASKAKLRFSDFSWK